jgi:hypothetical protein
LLVAVVSVLLAPETVHADLHAERPAERVVVTR